MKHLIFVDLNVLLLDEAHNYVHTHVHTLICAQIDGTERRANEKSCMKMKIKIKKNILLKQIHSGNAIK